MYFKDILICILGESGSGKSTIIELIKNERGYNYIKSYTTRKPRHNNDDTHIFVDRDKLDESIFTSKDILAFTEFDGEYYWAMKEQFRGKGVSLYIVDVKGYKDVLDNTITDGVVVVGIYLKVDKEVRVDRMVKERGLERALSRIKHDSDKFNVVPCNYVVDANRPILDVYRDVLDIIDKYVICGGE
ncbi:MAG: hypothetical protein QXD03_02555 [Candidatus Anstonellales archaeon]